MTKAELINKIRNNRSFDLRASEFYEPWDISDETIKDMADDFYYLLKDVLNYLVGKEEPVSEEQVKESLISKHENKTCKENGNSLTQEPASGDLEQAIDTYLSTYFGGEKEKQDWPFLKKMAIHFAEWQKEQLMKDSVLCGVDGWFINNKRNCRKNGRFYKYYESTITHDKPLPMENGKDYRLITIKEG